MGSSPLAPRISLVFLMALLPRLGLVEEREAKREERGGKAARQARQQEPREMQSLPTLEKIASPVST